ncbi:MAG: DNA adenine methyltransferase YhdJ [candidate division WS2 bacterium]|nr:DNA adenine methyltransferase YhdJ [Candidatus Psychracetigena formicireducens]
MLEVNKVYQGDCLELMRSIPDKSIDMVITSPPYNVGMPYGSDDRQYYSDYLNYMKEVLGECYRVLVSGGRIGINLPSTIMQSTKSRPAYLSLDFVLLMREIGFLEREWICWIKMKGGGIPGKSTSWGSWRSPSLPYLRDASEFIIIMDKETHKKVGDKTKIDITAEEFLQFTTNCWYMIPETNRWHPAPFPEELPYRLIKLYTYQEDIILDPFVGWGTTCVVAKKLNRQYIGIDNNPEYCRMATIRLANETNLFKEVNNE